MLPRSFRSCRQLGITAAWLALAIGFSAGESVGAEPGDDANAADDTTAADDPVAVALFESKVRPVLTTHCYECHSEREGVAEGGLTLDTREGLLVGGDRGAAVVPGKPSESWLLRAMTHVEGDLKMPPKRERLGDSVLNEIAQWIRLGAPDPRDGPTASGATEDRDAWATSTDHWAYAPLRDPELPTVQDASWPADPMDRFVLAKLETAELAPSADASPEVLARRLYFDLVGLPPTIDELSSFRRQLSAEGIDAAITAVVEDLLNRPAFGERWGRHWLDVARFAESSGKEANISFPYAWRYRDYVIDSFRDDVPLNRFLLEQLAGDLLPYDDSRQRARLLIATGFLALGPKNLDAMDAEQFQADLVDEQIDTVTRALIGSSVACARCHDHKFDPFTMQDYYALAGIFSSTKTFFGTAVSPANRVGGDPLPLPELEDQLVFHRSIPAERVRKLTAEREALLKEKRDGQRAAMAAAIRGKDPSEHFTLRDALRIFWRTGAIEGELEKVDAEGNAIPLAMGVLDRETVGDARLLRRGEIGQPAEAVPRRMPAAIRLTAVDVATSPVGGRAAFESSFDPSPRSPSLSRWESRALRLGDGPRWPSPGDNARPSREREGDIKPLELHDLVGLGTTEVQSDSGGRDESFDIPDGQSGRLQLARWLTDPRHPLTARVYVNRVWLHLMGSGIVSTVDNFGTTGQPPSHSELLDHLATRFIREGWSTKRLVRAMVLSRTYRQSSDFREDAFQVDPDNRLRWRMPKRRLEAEAIRDAMLAVSGELDLTRPSGSLVARSIGDKPISLIGLDRRLPADLDGATHRSVYLPVLRDRLPDVLELFDAADPSFVSGERETTNVPLQGLYLLNSPFVGARSEALAERIMSEREETSDRIGLAFELCFSRRPTAEEQKLVSEYLKSSSKERGTSAALRDFCQVLFGTGEFRHLD